MIIHLLNLVLSSLSSLGPWPDPTVIKQRYRELCVLLHPDKSPHPRAVDAFAALTQALSAALAAVQEQQGSKGGEGAAGREEALDDDEIFWMDGSGTISVPAAAKEATESKSGASQLHPLPRASLMAPV